MNVRWHAVALVVLLAVTAGCSPRPDELRSCTGDDPTECKALTAAELDKLLAAEDARVRRIAEALPFDYRDIVHALLVDYLRPSSVPNVEYRYFVRVFGRDVDVPLAARLHWSGVDVLPASEWTLKESHEANGHHISHVRVEVSDIDKIDRDTYAIAIGYYCGPLCAAGSTYTLRRDGNGWHVVDRQQHWVS